ncbi:MAG: VOC family protein [Rhodospirillaceae bacterium]|jgi:catechol 2,3-dioxygenase-like lactoylglutathione lyase family enzyme|nr:VOC family protein [Rhodospirillaceae bacterium]MBT7487500.1 VOC family protein [Rhodospirillales bacterium]MBT5240359.1 VOC family protein [Rhodospirillaceae bacterium]MBT5566998.1 VOC family protein [Rhodospirillaceae bacterium]MBT6088255.1 VOC family protein [Rhodospirillaceae bacterium]
MALVSPMVRTALFVSDIERSARFYEEILEITEVYAVGSLVHETAPKLLGMPPNTYVQYKILRSAGLNKGMVGLFEVSDPSPPTVAKRKEGCNIGETCLVFYCGDLDVVYERLTDNGHHIVSPPLLLEVEIDDGAVKKNEGGAGMREMTFRDPDGVMINLIEQDPASED